MHSKELKVFFDGNFWGHHGRSHAGKEIIIDKQFEWAGNAWYIPAVYICAQGLVIDYCVEVESEKIRDFIEKYAALEERADELSHEEYENAMKDNPTNVEFRAEVMINNKKSRSVQGCGVSWIPEECLPGEENNSSKVLELVEHYKLDKSKGWAIRRHSYKWATARKPVFNNIALKLSKPPVDIQGMQFKTPLPGESIRFTHPITDVEHELNVVNVEKQESKIDFGQEGYEFPKHSTCMMYTLSPDIPNAEFYIRDIKKNESPRLKTPVNTSENGSSSIGIIGGADGPTAIIMQPINKNPKLYVACSAITFEPVDEVEWRVVLRHAACEDIIVDII